MAFKLVINPQEGKIAANPDGFTQMNPYLVFTVGSQQVKTTISENGGLSPVWNQLLEFEISPQDSLINIVCFNHSESSHNDDYVADCQIDINQLKNQPRGSAWFEMTKNDSYGGKVLISWSVEGAGAPAFRQPGSVVTDTYASQASRKQSDMTYDSNFNDRSLTANDFHTPFYQSPTHQKNQYQTSSAVYQVRESGSSGLTGAVLKLAPMACELLPDPEMSAKVNPYLVLKCGEQEMVTPACIGGDFKPTWEDVFTFNLTGAEDSIDIICYNYDAGGSNDYLADRKLLLDDLLAKDSGKKWFHLKKSGASGGKILFDWDLVRPAYSHPHTQDLEVHTPGGGIYGDSRQESQIHDINPNSYFPRREEHPEDDGYSQATDADIYRSSQSQNQQNYNFMGNQMGRKNQPGGGIQQQSRPQTAKPGAGNPFGHQQTAPTFQKLPQGGIAQNQQIQQIQQNQAQTATQGQPQLLIKVLAAEFKVSSGGTKIMDPYVVLKIGDVQQVTKACVEGGMSPTWEDSFAFDMSKGGSQLELICYDHDSTKSDDYIADRVLTFEQLLAKKKGKKWFFLHRQGNNAGKILIEWNLFEGGQQQQQQQAQGGVPLQQQQQAQQIQKAAPVAAQPVYGAGKAVPTHSRQLSSGGPIQLEPVMVHPIGPFATAAALAGSGNAKSQEALELENLQKEQEELMRQIEEAKRQNQEEEQARKLEEQKKEQQAQLEAQRQAQLLAHQQAQKEAQELAQRKAQLEAQLLAQQQQQQAQKEAQELAQRKAQLEAQLLAQQQQQAQWEAQKQAELLAQQEAAKKQAELLAQQQKAQQEAAQKQAQLLAQQKAQQEAAQKQAQLLAQQKAQQEAAQKQSQLLAQQKAQQEAAQKQAQLLAQQQQQAQLLAQQQQQQAALAASNASQFTQVGKPSTNISPPNGKATSSQGVTDLSQSNLSGGVPAKSYTQTQASQNHSPGLRQIGGGLAQFQSQKGSFLQNTQKTLTGGTKIEPAVIETKQKQFNSQLTGFGQTQDLRGSQYLRQVQKTPNQDQKELLDKIQQQERQIQDQQRKLQEQQNQMQITQQAKIKQLADLRSSHYIIQQQQQTSQLQQQLMEKIKLQQQTQAKLEAFTKSQNLVPVQPTVQDLRGSQYVIQQGVTQLAQPIQTVTQINPIIPQSGKDPLRSSGYIIQQQVPAPATQIKSLIPQTGKDPLRSSGYLIQQQVPAPATQIKAIIPKTGSDPLRSSGYIIQQQVPAPATQIKSLIPQTGKDPLRSSGYIIQQQVPAPATQIKSLIPQTGKDPLRSSGYLIQQQVPVANPGNTATDLRGSGFIIANQIPIQPIQPLKQVQGAVSTQQKPVPTKTDLRTSRYIVQPKLQGGHAQEITTTQIQPKSGSDLLRGSGYIIQQQKPLDISSPKQVNLGTAVNVQNINSPANFGTLQSKQFPIQIGGNQVYQRAGGAPKQQIKSPRGFKAAQTRFYQNPVNSGSGAGNQLVYLQGGQSSSNTARARGQVFGSPFKLNTGTVGATAGGNYVRHNTNAGGYISGAGAQQRIQNRIRSPQLTSRGGYVFKNQKKSKGY